jgi:hypothetical protein
MQNNSFAAALAAFTHGTSGSKLDAAIANRLEADFARELSAEPCSSQQHDSIAALYSNIDDAVEAFPVALEYRGEPGDGEEFLRRMESWGL